MEDVIQVVLVIQEHADIRLLSRIIGASGDMVVVRIFQNPADAFVGIVDEETLESSVVVVDQNFDTGQGSFTGRNSGIRFRNALTSAEQENLKVLIIVPAGRLTRDVVGEGGDFIEKSFEPGMFLRAVRKLASR